MDPSTRERARPVRLPIPAQVAGALAIAGAIGVALALGAGVVGVAAVPAVLRTAVVTLALFTICGLPAAALLARGELRPHLWLMVLPLGGAICALVLAVLGLLHLPLAGSLAIVIATGLLASGAVLARGSWRGSAEAPPAAPPEPPWLLRVGLPLALATVVALISLMPSFRSGFATVPGQNGDAILVVGTATLLEHAPPTATRTDLPIPRIPIEWRSKYPIYYPLAAAAELAGQDPIAAFPTVAAIMLALGALGFFLFARVVLRAPPWVAILAGFAVPLDRIVMYVTMHPYYNELWGQFALPFMLVAGWRFLRAPSRAAGALFGCFAVLGLLAYPLMFPFPLLFLGTFAIGVSRRRHAAGQRAGWIAALRLPQVLARPWVWVPAVVVAIPVVAVLGRGVAEKIISALAVLAPWTNLQSWAGSALGYLPWPQFVGLPGNHWIDFAGLAVVVVLAVVGLRRVRPEVRAPLAVMAVVAALIGVYFRVRPFGELFFFKDLAFLGPYVLMLALIAIASAVTARARWARAGGAAGLLAVLVVLPNAAAAEINTTFDNATSSVLQLRAWNRELPAGSSVRIDVPPSGWQLWVGYMFVSHRLSTLNPLGGIFPHPVVARKADYVIAFFKQPRPADAIGPPLLRNQEYVLWRMNPAVPGPDLSQRALFYDYSTITIG